MSNPFDPYHRWLGISKAQQPPHHYRLLGLELFESDREVIRDAAERQTTHIRKYRLGPYAEDSQRLLNEISKAKACLSNENRKANYDNDLRKELKLPLEEAASVASTSIDAQVNSPLPDQSVGNASNGKSITESDAELELLESSFFPTSPVLNEPSPSQSKEEQKEPESEISPESDAEAADEPAKVEEMVEDADLPGVSNFEEVNTILPLLESTDQKEEEVPLQSEPPRQKVESSPPIRQGSVPEIKYIDQSKQQRNSSPQTKSSSKLTIILGAVFLVVSGIVLGLMFLLPGDGASLTLLPKREYLPPQVESVEEQTAVFGASWEFQVKASDQNEPEVGVRYQLGEGVPAEMRIDPDNGKIAWKVNFPPGRYPIPVKIRLAAENTSTKETSLIIPLRIHSPKSN
ncbi:Hypothetical protein PBC10988_9130 [Planctomycetales bacterium 10988]|nr:Hypothetical protein PBC10988_9130 [Planctomycetales bacterium 10988]